MNGAYGANKALSGRRVTFDALLEGLDEQAADAQALFLNAVPASVLNRVPVSGGGSEEEAVQGQRLEISSPLPVNVPDPRVGGAAAAFASEFSRDGVCSPPCC